MRRNKVLQLIDSRLHLMLSDEDGSFDIALKLMTDLEPKRLDRLVELSKEKRQLDANIKKFRSSVEEAPEQTTEANLIEIDKQ